MSTQSLTVTPDPSPRGAVGGSPKIVGVWRERESGMALKFHPDGTFASYQVMPKDGPTSYILSMSSISQFKLIFKGHETITAVCSFGNNNTLNFSMDGGTIVFERWDDTQRIQEFVQEVQRILDTTSDTLLEKQLKALEKRYLYTLDDLKATNNKTYTPMVGAALTRLQLASPKSSLYRRTVVADERRSRLETESHLDRRLVGIWLMPFFPRGPPQVNVMLFHKNGVIELPLPGVKHREKGSFLTNERANPCTIDCLFKGQLDWDYGIYDLNEDCSILRVELGERGKRKRPPTWGNRTIKAKRVLCGDMLEFLKAFQALLEPLKAILKKENVDLAVLASFLTTSSTETLADQNSKILKMQEIFSKIKAGEQFRELENLYQVTLQECKSSSDPSVKRAITDLVSSLV
eukprot:TRINITY_DN16668_c0_g1_i1.p1 TRINITY_DN16668_c0_g1~~TRINITY_DN16668_c0_g1_i1.p1  ORF type:complete len:457 (-),score=96.93 TRINITY_DN16668_c0_g1_i1:38-1255(-)